MTETQLADLYHLLRLAPMVGAVVLLGEWMSGLAFVGLPFRWGIPFIQRSVRSSNRGLPRTRVDGPRAVVVPTQEGDWLFRSPQSILMVATPFPVHGQIVPKGGSLHIVGRHPIGGVLFLGGVIAQQVLQSVAPILAPSLAAKGLRVELGGLGVWLAMAAVFYGGSLALERHRFLGAVEEIVALATPGNQHAA